MLDSWWDMCSSPPKIVSSRPSLLRNPSQCCAASGNKLSSEGAQHLATTLTWNAALQSITLQCVSSELEVLLLLVSVGIRACMSARVHMRVHTWFPANLCQKNAHKESPERIWKLTNNDEGLHNCDK